MKCEKQWTVPYDRKKIIEHLRMLHRVFVQCWHTCQLRFFWKILWIGFSRSLKAIERWWARFRLSFVVVNIKKIIFFIKLRLHKGRCSPVIIWLCLWFSSICLVDISQNFHNLSCLSFKSQVFSSSISNLVL